MLLKLKKQENQFHSNNIKIYVKIINFNIFNKFKNKV